MALPCHRRVRLAAGPQVRFSDPEVGGLSLKKDYLRSKLTFCCGDFYVRGGRIGFSAWDIWNGDDELGS